MIRCWKLTEYRVVIIEIKDKKIVIVFQDFIDFIVFIKLHLCPYVLLYVVIMSYKYYMELINNQISFCNKYGKINEKIFSLLFSFK